MSVIDTLARFTDKLVQCESLIDRAHQSDAGGTELFNLRDREQITAAAFLNQFVAWEEFIESALADFMTGEAGVSGRVPTRFVSPSDREHSLRMIVHTHKYFNYSNHEGVRKLAGLYFEYGHPFETSLRSIDAQLGELRVIRNACAHLSSTTTRALEAVAGRIFGQRQPSITVYSLLTATDPRDGAGGRTVYGSYKAALVSV